MIKDWQWKFIERPKRIIHSFIFYKLLRWDNVRLIQRDVNKHRNELVYDSPFRVVRLMGWTDRKKDDYYWVIYDRTNGVCLSSCVGGFIWLKNYLPLWEYHYADEIFEINAPIENIILAIKDKNIILK
jgi:hypothetical protein